MSHKHHKHHEHGQKSDPTSDQQKEAGVSGEVPAKNEPESRADYADPATGAPYTDNATEATGEISPEIRARMDSDRVAAQKNQLAGDRNGTPADPHSENSVAVPMDSANADPAVPVAPPTQERAPEVPSMGRIVHYQGHERGVCPAVITAVYEDGTLGLFLFHEGGYTNYARATMTQPNVPGAGSVNPDGWYWPPRTGASAPAFSQPPLNVRAPGEMIPASGILDNPSNHVAPTASGEYMPQAAPVIPQTTNPTEIPPNQLATAASTPVGVASSTVQRDDMSKYSAGGGMSAEQIAAGAHPGVVPAIAAAAQAETQMSVDVKGDANIANPVKEPDTYVAGASQGAYSNNATVESVKEAEATAQHPAVNPEALPHNAQQKAAGLNPDQVHNSTFSDPNADKQSASQSNDLAQADQAGAQTGTGLPSAELAEGANAKASERYVEQANASKANSSGAALSEATAAEGNAAGAAEEKDSTGSGQGNPATDAQRVSGVAPNAPVTTGLADASKDGDPKQSVSTEGGRVVIRENRDSSAPASDSRAGGQSQQAQKAAEKAHGKKK